MIKKFKKEKLVFANPLKLRVPIPKCGGAMKLEKDKKSFKRPRITIYNWDKF